MWYRPAAMGPQPTSSDSGRALALGLGLATGLGLGVAAGADARLGRARQQVETDDADDDDGRHRHRQLEGVGHAGRPPRLPEVPALCGRGELVEHAVQDAVREHRDAILQPRPDNAGGVAFEVHWATFHATGWASASSAARSPRIA